jgi:hypothetical protein
MQIQFQADVLTRLTFHIPRDMLEEGGEKTFNLQRLESVVAGVPQEPF